MTALHWAADLGNPDMAALLLAAGASPLAETRIGRVHAAARGGEGGHAAVFERCWRRSADVTALTTTGASPLHFAAAAGSGESVAVLLDAGAGVDVRASPQWGQTPLMFAAGSGRTEVVKLLLARGADAACHRQSRGPQRAQSRGRCREPGAERAGGRRSSGSWPPHARRRARRAAPAAPRAARGGDTSATSRNRWGMPNWSARRGVDGAAADRPRRLRGDGIRPARARRRHQPGERVRPHQPVADGHDQRPLRPRDEAARARRRREAGERLPAPRRSTAC